MLHQNSEIYEEKLTALKREIDNNAIIVEKFNSSLSTMDILKNSKTRRRCWT